MPAEPESGYAPALMVSATFHPLAKRVLHAACRTWLLLGVAAVCAACSRTAEDPAPAEPLLEAGDSPFALEIKEAVLRRLVEILEERLGTGYVYILDDAAHGDELVQRLRGGAVEVTNRVVVALQDGAVVTYETQQPAVMCALEVSAWTADDAQVAGIWYASAELEGREAFDVVWESPRWLILDEGKER